MQGELRHVLTIVGQSLKKLLVLAGAFFLIEVLAAGLLKPDTFIGLLFGMCWAMGLASVCLLLPRAIGGVFFGITYFLFLIWTLAQTGYHCIFNRMMWVSDVFYIGEGAGFIDDVLGNFPAVWWIGGIGLIGVGTVLICRFPKVGTGYYRRVLFLIIALESAIWLLLLPDYVFLRDLHVWGTGSEYAQSSSYRATYNTMYDAGSAYDICGIYQLTFRDIWKHEIYPSTLSYRNTLAEETAQINDFFSQRTKEENDMTGFFQGKNVVLVLMESMDDWLITQNTTPTLWRLMKQGINFTNFYTPGYGTARTLNSEFCINTGIYLPTNGKYVFDYVTNDFSQSIASQATQNGYTAEVFHYNSPEFYSRGVFEPAMGYGAYHCYADYVTDNEQLYDDCLLFEVSELKDLFFRKGKTFNTIITRSAHLGYTYNEALSYYALKKYPQYRNKYASQEEDCARAKAKLVDDMFARLLRELEKKGLLKDTIIIGVTDHYTYGFKNKAELCRLSGVEHDVMLEKTPCFLWSVDGPGMTVDKTLNTSDLLPTILNLLGINSPYTYLGQDAFDTGYEGYVIFPNGNWICEGVTCVVGAGGEPTIIENSKGKKITKVWLNEMHAKSQEFIRISNLLLTSNYYLTVYHAEN